MAFEDADLALERKMIEPLVEADLDRKRERVAAAGHRTRWTDGCFDAATTPAHVLLLFDLHEVVGDLDDIDHLRLFELILHRLEVAAAARTWAICIVELERAFDDRQIRLFRRPRRRSRLCRA
jgi:hypothetical protein